MINKIKSIFNKGFKKNEKIKEFKEVNIDKIKHLKGEYGDVIKILNILVKEGSLKITQSSLDVWLNVIGQLYITSILKKENTSKEELIKKIKKTILKFGEILYVNFKSQYIDAEE